MCVLLILGGVSSFPRFKFLRVAPLRRFHLGRISVAFLPFPSLPNCVRLFCDPLVLLRNPELPGIERLGVGDSCRLKNSGRAPSGGVRNASAPALSAGYARQLDESRRSDRFIFPLHVRAIYLSGAGLPSNCIANLLGDAPASSGKTPICMQLSTGGRGSPSPRPVGQVCAGPHGSLWDAFRSEFKSKLTWALVRTSSCPRPESCALGEDLCVLFAHLSAFQIALSSAGCLSSLQTGKDHWFGEGDTSGEGGPGGARCGVRLRPAVSLQRVKGRAHLPYSKLARPEGESLVQGSR